MIGSELSRYWQGRFLFGDTEGEGLSLGFSRPWQVSWGLGSIKKLDVVKTRFIYWSDLNVSRDAAIITRFDPIRYAKEARPAREVLDELLIDLYDLNHRLIWQRGLGYDVYMLRNWARGCGVTLDESYLLRSIDTDPILKAQIKGWVPDISSPEAFLAWQYKGANYIEKGLKTNLTDIGRARKIEHDYSTLHDAENDIRLMAKVFEQVVYEVEF